MTAFENLGVMPEIGLAVDKQGWNLPTDIQQESIPLILGGGDVLMAAETGSGKTAAFSIPVIQIVHETFQDVNRPNSGKGSSSSAQLSKCKMNPHDRGDKFAIATDGLLCQCREFRDWHGSRANFGVTSGKYYYEARCKDEGLNRVGWSTIDANLNLGTDKWGFGFGGTGKKSNSRNFDTYGQPFTQHDIIGCYLDMDQGKISFSKNGKHLGHAFDIPGYMLKMPFYPAVVLKNSEIELNFGFDGFKFQPLDGFSPMHKCQNKVKNPKSGGAEQSQNKTKAPNAPYAIIIEPSRELAEQTYNIIRQLSQPLTQPRLNSVLCCGGSSVSDQLRGIKEGVDILIGTPGRVNDFVQSGKVNLNQVRFLVLDECDGLLTAGHGNFINTIHSRIPKVTFDGKKLQVIICSATLHSFDVKKLSEKIMSFPTWVDLKGEDSVPDTVHHVVVPVDPVHDPSWMGLRRKVITDGVHFKDDVTNRESMEKRSEGIKILKGEYCVRAIKQHKMEQSIIFCRTRLDCDNLEKYFTELGGGKDKPGHMFSCVCLHSGRKEDRSRNLQKFKDLQVNHLICTDVAARGIDIRGVPYVINVTLPSNKEDYVHRIGRVGRADRMGLAISLVATQHKEKVWYHSNCRNRNRCYQTHLVEQGGCCIWYDEKQLLGDIESHLKITIEQIGKNINVPVNEFDGKVTYGEKRGQKSGSLYKGHADILAPQVRDLQKLEKSAQLSYLMLANRTKELIGSF